MSDLNTLSLFDYKCIIKLMKLEYRLIDQDII